ncbi:unnamed protein product [Protopolystoma xenopodis]|uniref:Uncharacterized protein n=1 Tax=Protopolystoma xenopodis TaxID=117903 RepID=A0A448WQX2_9PLAT|nr:unnamed protein product [Protopolystoma xenopodis]
MARLTDDVGDTFGYRNFRTFSVDLSGHETQFASLAVDELAEMVAAGSLDTFEAHVWAVKTGQLLTTLTGENKPNTS